MSVLRIMLVEDDAVIALLFSEVLTDMGFDVCAVAGTEEEAISAAERTKPQLMIVDAQLGDGSGINAVDVIEQSGAVPHFFISGNSARVRALRPNALVVQKPFCEPELAQAIKQTMAVS